MDPLDLDKMNSDHNIHNIFCIGQSKEWRYAIRPSWRLFQVVSLHVRLDAPVMLISAIRHVWRWPPLSLLYHSGAAAHNQFVPTGLI